jgi:heme o synthase
VALRSVEPHLSARPLAPPARWRAVLRSYAELTKPKVVAAIIFTALVGMLLATDHPAPLGPMLIASVGIWLAAASAAALNHLLDRRLDAAMSRTRRRPLPRGELTERAVLVFAVALGALSMSILAFGVNPLTALLTLGSLIGYSLIYTAWLKPLTPQNIVIGGAAGAAPPILGWAAMRNAVDANALLLFLLIFIWTPAHFWALAIARRREYAKAGVPMLPVTHGIPFTCDHVLMYTVLLAFATLLPFLSGMCGFIYLAVAAILDALFVIRALELRAHPSAESAMRAFHYSIRYLLLLFGALLIDHYWRLR